MYPDRNDSVSHDLADRVTLVIMAKAPIPGYAKTRLIPLLGETGAASLQRWLMQRAVATAVVADVGPIHLWCAGPPDHADFAECRAYGNVSLHPQPEGDLGFRMLTAAQNARSSAGVLIIGTDCPVLTPALLREAALALSTHDIVLVPAEDGGYVLIGLRRPLAEVFAHMDWGTGNVMAHTRERLAKLGLNWLELPTLWDVDRPGDYERLASTISEVRELSLSP